jgi:hypothetical protein
VLPSSVSRQLAGARAKLERAQQHIDLLKSEFFEASTGAFTDGTCRVKRQECPERVAAISSQSQSDHKAPPSPAISVRLTTAAAISAWNSVSAMLR